jgi:hypothetical protein
MLIIPFFFLNPACSVMPEYASSELFACEVDRACRVQGRLQIFTGGVGSGTVRGKGYCYDLALPKEVLQNFPDWNGKLVELSGEATWRPQLSGVSWFDIRDRRIEGMGCGELVIYVETVSLLRDRK